NRLSPRRRAEMIMLVTGGKALPREITDQIVDRTDGVPLFIEELTKAVVESGILTKAGDGYAVTGPGAPLAIPTSLQASLLARLDRLPPTREVRRSQPPSDGSSHMSSSAPSPRCPSSNWTTPWRCWCAPN